MREVGDSLYISHFKHRGAHQDPGLVSRFLLRSEAIAPSSIEGIAPNPKNVALAELALEEVVRGLSDTAQLVARNMTIVRDASDTLSEKDVITVADLETLQASLITATTELQGRGQRRTGSAGRGTTRAYVSLDVLDLLTRSERAMASSDVDTASSPPMRPVPVPRTR